MMIVLTLLGAAALLGTGLAVPSALAAAAERREARAAEAALAEERRVADERTALEREATRRSAAATERERQVAAIRIDPQRHIYRTMLAALRQRILQRRQAQADAERYVARATTQRADAEDCLATFLAANAWLTSTATRKVVLGFAVIAPVYLGLVLMLDAKITRAVFDGAVGVLSAPAAMIAIGVGSSAVCWGLALFDRSARPFGSRARGVAVTGGVLLVGVAVGLMIHWAPYRTAEIYDPQIADAQVALARLEQSPNDDGRLDGQLEAAQAEVAKLQEREHQLQSGDQWLVGGLALGEAAAIEAILLSTLIRRRNRLEADVAHWEQEVHRGEDAVAAAETDLAADVARVVEVMVTDLTDAEFPLDQIRPLIATTLDNQRDLTLFRQLLTDTDDDPRPDSGSAEPEATVIAGTVVGPFVEEEWPEPTPPVEVVPSGAAPTAGSVPVVEEVPMPEDVAPTPVDLGDLDEAL